MKKYAWAIQTGDYCVVVKSKRMEKALKKAFVELAKELNGIPEGEAGLLTSIQREGWTQQETIWMSTIKAFEKSGFVRETKESRKLELQ